MKELLASKTKSVSALHQSLVDLQGEISRNQLLFNKLTEDIVLKKQRLNLEKQKVRYFKEEQEKQISLQ